MTEEKTKLYGDFTNRMFAATLDLAIVYLPIDFFTRLIFNHVYPNGSAFQEYSAKVLYERPDLATQMDKVVLVIMQKYPNGAVQMVDQLFFMTGIQFLLLGLYIIPMLKIYNATFAKKILGLKVVDNITGKDLTWSQSIIRYIGYVPSVGLLGIGLLMGIFSKRKRALHDLLADTVVVYDEDRWYKKQIKKLRKYFHMDKDK